MGADGSKMGIAAMSVVSGVQKDDILKLRTSFKEHSERSGENKDVSGVDFDESLKLLESLDPSDAELFEKLFILFDESGENKIDIKDFLVSISLLVNSGTVSDKLLFAFTVFDDTESGAIFATDCKKLFTALNVTASFFGDPVMKASEIKELVDAIWAECSEPSAPLQYADHIDFIVNHEISHRFTSGQGSVRFEN